METCWGTTLTVRLIRSFEYRSIYNVVYHNVDLSQKVNDFMDFVLKDVMSKTGIPSPFKKAQYDTMKIEHKRHGAKSNDAVINVENDESLILVAEKTLAESAKEATAETLGKLPDKLKNQIDVVCSLPWHSLGKALKAEKYNMDSDHCISSILHFEGLSKALNYFQQARNINYNDILQSPEQQMVMMNSILNLLNKKTLCKESAIDLFHMILCINGYEEEHPILFYELLSQEDLLKKILIYLNANVQDDFEVIQLCLCAVTKIFDCCANKRDFVNALLCSFKLSSRMAVITKSTLQLFNTRNSDDSYVESERGILNCVCVILNLAKKLYQLEFNCKKYKTIIFKDLLDPVFKCLQEWYKEDDVCEYSLLLLFEFLKDYQNEFMKNVSYDRILNEIIVLLNFHYFHEQISKTGCLFITTLACIVNDALTKHGLSTTTQFQTVEVFVTTIEVVVEFICKQQAFYKHSAVFVKHYLNVTCELSRLNFFKDQLTQYSLIRNLTEIVLRHISDSGIVALVFNTLWKLHVPVGTDDSQWLSTLFEAMKTHLDNAKVQEMACHALSEQISLNPSVCNLIGEENPNLLAVHSLVFAALNIHLNDVYVFQAACGAIYEMGIHSTVLQHYLVARGAYVPIMKEMKEKTNDIEIHSWGLRALRALAYQNPHQKELLFMYGILSLLKTNLFSFGDDFVLKECIGLLACLATDLEIVRRECVRTTIPDLIMQTAIKKQLSEELVEISLEAIAVFATSEEQPMLHIEYLRYIRQMMSSNSDRERIQQNGCIIVQLIAAHEHFISNTQVALESIAIVSEAMKRFEDNIAVQTEGTIAIYLLMEHMESISTNVKNSIVELKIHDLLFGIIEYFKKEDEISLLAQKCIIELTSLQALKDVLLQSACFLSYPLCVDFMLQLGAEVDTGNPTPLCVAASACNIDIIQLLLSHDASDVAEALAICLEDGKWTAAGVLLRHIGFEENNGVITWSALNMKELNPELLFPTLLKKQKPRLDAETRHSPTSVGLRLHSRRKSLSFNEDKPLHRKQITPEKYSSRGRSSSLLHQDHNGGSNSGGRTRKTLSGAILPYNKLDPRLERRSSYEKHIVVTSSRNNMHYPNYPNSLLTSEMSDQRFGIGELFNPDRAITPDMVEKSREAFRKSLTDINLMSIDRVQKKSFCSYVEEQPPLKLKRHSSPPKRKAKSCFEVFQEEKSDNIKTFDVSHNNVTDLSNLAYCPSEVITNFFKKLELLDVSHNLLQDFPTGIIFLQLSTINLSHNRIIRFPYEIFRQENIEKIDLSHNQILEIRGSHFAVSLSLTCLDVSFNKLRVFPSWMAGVFPRLSKLFLAHNQIKDIPSSTNGLRALTELNLSHNQINKLAEKFFNECISLEKVDLSHNNLMMLPNYTPSTLSRLTTIKLSHNLLKDRRPFYIPKLILSIPSLQYLDISHNRISQLPETQYWSSKVIRELNFSENRIVTMNLSKNVASAWPEISRLNLAYNKLTELPREIGHLTTLMSLDVSHNPISTLPDEIGRLVNIYDFPLDGLKLCHDSASLGTPRELVSFFGSKLKNAVSYRRIKLMLVGRAGRGKTTLVRQLANKKHPLISLATNGISIDDWTLHPPKSIKDRNKTRKSFSMNTWDFAGQEDFYCTHQYFLSPRALYLAVYNASRGVEELTQLTPWLLNVQAAGPGSMVILVGTHADKIPRNAKKEHVELLSAHIRQYITGPGFPIIRATAIVNCTRETKGMEYLREEIYKIISTFSYKGQPIVNQLVPKSYMELEKYISEEAAKIRSTNTIPMYHRNKLWKLCCDKSIHLNYDEFGRALKFLKETGLILNFNDTLFTLSDLYFIDPQWLCEIMARVVTVKEINPYITNQGVLSKDDAKNLFPDGKYSKEFLDRYFRLLRKFEVVLPITADRYLVTSKLQSIPPQWISVKQNQFLSAAVSNVVTRRYVFPYVPNGFWARLITRVLSAVLSIEANEFQPEKQSCQQEYWQQGIFIEWTPKKYFLINVVPNKQNEFDLYAPNTKTGYKLLANVVNLIDSLIEEWYPGLSEEGDGIQSIQRLCPCYSCFYSEQFHLFQLIDCINASYKTDVIECPNCGPRNISSIAPDATFSDLNEDLLYDLTNQIQNNQSSKLDSGSFAAVYKANVNGVNLAIKVFTESHGSNPNRLLRQEVDILTRLHHPCLMSIIGVSLRPRMILLEYAPLGNLATTLSSGRGLSRGMQHRIALQISEGLAYLHQHQIAYRDLKPSNILVFSLSMAMLINVKITDYGISQETSLLGLHAPKGTLGFQAPEVTNSDSEYSVKVDVFSFGITLYQIVTGGQMPYGDIPFQNELENCVLKNKRITNIATHGCSPWPDIENLIEKCLTVQADRRPTMDEIRNALLNVDLLCLKREVKICKDQTIECVAVRDTSGSTEVWVGTGTSKSYGQLSWFSLGNNKNQAVQGMIVKDGRIYCMLVYKKYIVVGTGVLKIEGNSNKDVITIIQPRIAVFDGDLKRRCFGLEVVSDSVLCLQYVPSKDFIIAGLSNGEVLCYQAEQLCENGIPLRKVNFQQFMVSEVIGPATCTIISGNSILMGYGKFVVEFSSENLAFVRSFPVSQSGAVLFLAQSRHYIYTSTKDSSVITVWNLDETDQPRFVIDCHLILTQHYKNLDLTVRGSRVVSMVVVDRSVLWVGCGDGHIILFDLVKTKYRLLSTFWRHASAVRSMVVAPSADGKSASVITGGLGFKQFNQASDECYDFGYVLVWEAELAKQQKHLESERKKRDELALQMAEEALEEGQQNSLI